jgi:four helix bundle protein
MVNSAASSVPANIAEGHGRFYYQDNVRFCYFARGSLTETYSHISLAHELVYVPAEKYKEMTKLAEELVRIINGYIAYLKRSKMDANEPGANHFVREESASCLIDYPQDTESSENQ